ncbi:hypothetical protein GCM10010483_53680 [Actinokineospora diospyrosa]
MTLPANLTVVATHSRRVIDDCHCTAVADRPRTTCAESGGPKSPAAHPNLGGRKII